MAKPISIAVTIKWTGPDDFNREHQIASWLRRILPPNAFTEDFDPVYRKNLLDAGTRAMVNSQQPPQRIAGWDDEVVSLDYDIQIID